MGSPLAPVLANLFMGHHEKLWLENFQCSNILFYRKYVDDTFCLIHSEHDVLIDDSDSNSFLTRVYRKKTFSGLLTYYFSFTSYSYKEGIGLIRPLVDRAYKINNTWLGLHEDITKLTEILKKEPFPCPFN